MPIGRRYFNANGRIIGQHNVNGRVDFLTDALGNVTALANQSAEVTNSYRYKPYGGVLAETGVAPDPLFQWNGSWGYRFVLPRRYADHYVRARHCGNKQGAWTTPLAVGEQMMYGETAYAYAFANPVNYVDPSGLVPPPVPAPVPQGVGELRKLSDAEDRCCCCCPTGLRFDNVRDVEYRLDGEWIYGHVFNVKTGYNYHKIGPGEHEGDCSLEWWEKSTVKGRFHPTPRVWRELYDPHKYESPVFHPWNVRRKPCPGSGGPTLEDPPGIWRDKVGQRTLCFRILLRKAPYCDCPVSVMIITARQRLEVDHGYRFRDWTSPMSSAFCAWP